MQEHIWEREYKNPKLVTKEAGPQPVVVEFFRYLRKEHKIPTENLKILDLGCGTGRNSNHLASLGNEVVGMEISSTALSLAKDRADKDGITGVTYIKQSIGAKFPFKDASFDVALDVTTSNSLSETERGVYLSEVSRVLKPGGFLFFRGLCKDGDQNAKELIKRSPGPEKDTYIMPEMGLVERVFTKEDFMATYSPFFEILKLEKSIHYSRFNDRIYKRNYWVAYLKKT